MGLSITGLIKLPLSCVGNDQVKSDAAIAIAKQQHLHKGPAATNFALAIDDTPVAREEIVFVASAAGTITAVKALLNDTGLSGSVTFDCKKNGTTILSSTFDVDSGDADRDVLAGTISGSSGAIVPGDVISLSMAVSGTDGTGPYAWLEIDEAAP